MNVGEVVDLLEREGLAPRANGGGYVGRCPAHEDNKPSLSVGEGDDGKVLLKCFAGCDLEDITGALGLEAKDLFAEEIRPEIVNVYDYCDAAGNLLYQVVRYFPKDFRNRAPDGAGGWIWSTKGIDRVPYRLRDLLACEPGAPVWICEGEKDAERACKEIGEFATTAGGVSNWRPAMADHFRDLTVTVVADNDVPGLEAAERIRKDLVGVARSVRVVLPAEGKDLSDHFDAGRTVAEFRDATPKVSAIDCDTFLAMPEPAYSWLIPDLIERGDRVILTGEEGKGKSTLLRQIALRCAAGLHPFHEEAIEPLKVLVVDVENSPRQVRRSLRPLRELVGDRLRPDHLLLRIEPASFDLVSDPEPFEAIIAEHKPDIVITGPAYKLHEEGDSKEEGPAKAIARVLDRVRVDNDCAIFLEAHSPYASSGGARPIRPFGASLWSRWPEFGLHIAPDGTLKHWRGQRDQRSWPSGFTRGGRWPWTPLLDQGDDWKPTGIMETISRALERSILGEVPEGNLPANGSAHFAPALRMLREGGFAEETRPRVWKSVKSFVDPTKGFSE